MYPSININYQCSKYAKQYILSIISSLPNILTKSRQDYIVLAFTTFSILFDFLLLFTFFLFCICFLNFFISFLFLSFCALLFS